MKQIMKTIALVAVFITFLSCNHSPKPIAYGDDGCYYCKMTIVDKIHGAELITDKGKVFKFDATECMLNYAADENVMETAIFLTNHYESPTSLISAKQGTFLISDKLPSPMGEYLTAFESLSEAEKVQAEKGGELYTWEGLKMRLTQ